MGRTDRQWSSGHRWSSGGPGKNICFRHTTRILASRKGCRLPQRPLITFAAISSAAPPLLQRWLAPPKKPEDGGNRPKAAKRQDTDAEPVPKGIVLTGSDAYNNI